MAHQIVFEHVSGDECGFRSLRVVWEPYTNRVALHFQNSRESAHGLVGTPQEIIDYLDTRAATGAPWDRGAPREARRRLVALIGIAPRKLHAPEQA